MMMIGMTERRNEEGREPDLEQCLVSMLFHRDGVHSIARAFLKI